MLSMSVAGISLTASRAIVETNKGTVLVSILFCIDMQSVLTLRLEQPAHASGQYSVTQLLSLPNHDNWVLAHQGLDAKTSAILLLGNVLVVCAAEDCTHKVGGCWN